jgi:RNA polymerase sigma-70 factor (ECF subfamily)
MLEGKPRAYGYVYDKNKDWIFNKVNSIVRNECESEEVVQDIFTKVFESAATFKGLSSLNTWIYRITLNHAFNRRRYLNMAKRNMEMPYDPTVLAQMSPGLDPAMDTLDAPLTFEQIIPFIKELEANQRKVFILCMLQRKSYAKAAAAMDCSVDSVRGLLHRAKKNIRIKAIKKLSGEKPKEHSFTQRVMMS